VSQPQPPPGPARGRAGTEPVTARSALGLRLVLSIAGVVLFVALTVLLALWAGSSGPRDSPDPTALVVLAVICGLLAVIAAVDLVVVVRRRSHPRNR
jgi:sterol desaturase/sphingolipid hydroxylase (fatty acid hydroxylase superfamily)